MSVLHLYSPLVEIAALILGRGTSDLRARARKPASNAAARTAIVQPPVAPKNATLGPA
jgi:hypothetical protein